MANGCSSATVIRVYNYNYVNKIVHILFTFHLHTCSIIVSFETLAENLVEQNDNFTNITLPRTNLVFQGTRVSISFVLR